MLDVKLLTKPDPDYSLFYSVAAKASGYSVTNLIDQYGLDPKNIDSLLIAMYCSLDQVDLQTIRKSYGDLLKHFHYTFLVASTSKIPFRGTTLINHVIEASNSTFLTTVSGTLYQFQEALLNCCVSYTSYNLRSFLNQALILLEKEGYILNDHVKRYLEDGTYGCEFNQRPNSVPRFILGPKHSGD